MQETRSYPQAARLRCPSASGRAAASLRASFAEEFVAEYALPGRPAALEGCMQSWPALAAWTPEYFARAHGACEVTARRCRETSATRRMRLEEYIAYMQTAADPDPYYLSNWQFARDIPELLGHYQPPEFFESWHLGLPPEIRPCWQWLYIGGAGTGTRMHVDVLMTSAWNAVAYGRKRWLFWPPEQEPLLYGGDVDAFNPDLERFPRFAESRPIECWQGPGDIVFTPSRWWHQVRNESASISITENFINASNAAHVRDYLARSSDEVKRRFHLPAEIDLEGLLARHIPAPAGAPAQTNF